MLNIKLQSLGMASAMLVKDPLKHQQQQDLSAQDWPNPTNRQELSRGHVNTSEETSEEGHEHPGEDKSLSLFGKCSLWSLLK